VVHVLYISLYNTHPLSTFDGCLSLDRGLWLVQGQLPDAAHASVGVWFGVKGTAWPRLSADCMARSSSFPMHTICLQLPSADTTFIVYVVFTPQTLSVVQAWHGSLTAGQLSTALITKLLYSSAWRLCCWLSMMTMTGHAKHKLRIKKQAQLAVVLSCTFCCAGSI
jgi:uncharacterized membrane protein